MLLRSTHDPGLRLAKTPIVTPSTVAKTMAVNASSQVAGNVRAISAVTGRPVTIESPRSPRPKLPKNRTYWTASG